MSEGETLTSETAAAVSSVKNCSPSFLSFDELTYWYKPFLRIIGILPFEGRRDFSHLASRLHLLYCLVWSLIYWTSFVFYIINAKKVPAIDTICETAVVVGVSIRYYMLLRRRAEFTNLLDESRAIWDEYDEDGHRAVGQFTLKIRLLFMFLLGSIHFTFLMYITSTVIVILTTPRQNDTLAHYLPYHWYKEDGWNLWPGYKIIFTVQAVVIQNACVVVSTIDSAAPFLIMIGAGYFRALRHRISRIADRDEDETTLDFELVECARLHQRILNFCSRIDKITRDLFFVQLLCTVYVISLVGIKIVGTDPDRYKFMPFIISNIGQLFICQWAPDQLIDESTAISTAVYSVSVTWMRRRLGKMLIVIMARSQRPVQMTAAAMVNLSLENFGSMLTSAASFFTVLRNFNV